MPYLEITYECNNFVLSLLKGKLPSQNKPVLALLIHDVPLRNIVEPLNDQHEFSEKLIISQSVK